MFIEAFNGWQPVLHERESRIMSDNSYRALVVDDEPAVRNLAIRALQRRRIFLRLGGRRRGSRGDDLRPSLTMSSSPTCGCRIRTVTLSLPICSCWRDRPAVVILTGVLEPKIAKDMTARGVDCIEFKPVNYPLFAAKVKGLVDGRKLHAGIEIEKSSASAAQSSENAPRRRGRRQDRAARWSGNKTSKAS